MSAPDRRAMLDRPPFRGAWHIGPRAPSFVTFIPNALCLPWLPVNLTVWAMARTAMVRQLLGSETIH